MRVALFSDIHGNLAALEAVLADLRGRGPFDQVVVAGDLVWAGPWPAQVVDAVRSVSTAVIQGNTDAFFRHTAGEAPAGKREDRFASHLEWMQDQLGPGRAEYLAGLPFAHRIAAEPGRQRTARSRDLLVVHANPGDQERAITPGMSQADLDELLPDTGDWAALAFGHLHIPFARGWRGRLLVDVASTGLSMDGDPRAAYAILTWRASGWRVEHRRVAYDVRAVAHQMRTCGMPRGRHFAERLLSTSYCPPVVPFFGAT